jgi:hypothetical protein
MLIAVAVAVAVIAPLSTVGEDTSRGDATVIEHADAHGRTAAAIVSATTTVKRPQGLRSPRLLTATILAVVLVMLLRPHIGRRRIGFDLARPLRLSVVAVPRRGPPLVV